MGFFEDSSRVYWVGVADAARLLGVAEEQARVLMRKHDNAFSRGGDGEPYYPILAVLETKDQIERNSQQQHPSA